MKYDFTSIIDRKGKDALAVDILPNMLGPGKKVEVREGLDYIPMWVADMNFPALPKITEAIIERAKHPTYGYFITRDEYYNSIIKWHEERNHVTGLKKEHIGYENGVLGGVASALHAVCSQGDNVLVHAPTYIGFTGTLNNNGYHIIHSPLKKDEEGIWRMDFEDMEEKIVKNKIHAAVFCSPHNPTGRVWERWEIEKAMEIYKKYDVTVISDEIWSDIILYGTEHIPTQSVSEDAKQRTVALYAPSKTFNLAGLQTSNIFIPNRELRHRFRKAVDQAGYSQLNTMGLAACRAAYEEGGEWLEQLKGYLQENLAFARDYIANNLPGIHLIEPEGTYLIWLDLRELGLTEAEREDLIVNKAKLWLDSGAIFGEDGEGFERINIACPRATLQEAFDRLAEAVK